MSGPAQNIEWYLAREGQQYGPVSEAELEKILELGHLREQDLVWRAGFAEWRPAKDVFPNVFATNAGLSPPPPADRPGPRQPGAGGPGPHQRGPATQPGHGPHAGAAGGGGYSRGGVGQGGVGGQHRPGMVQRPGAETTGGNRYGQQPGPGGQPGAQTGGRTGPGQDVSQFAPHDRRHVIENAGVEAQIEQARMRERPSPEQVRWGDEAVHPSAAVAAESMRRGQAATRGVRRPEGYGADIDDLAELPPRRRSSVARVLWSLVLACVIGGASALGWMAYTNSGATERLLAQFTGQIGASAKPEVVAAPKEPTRVAVNAPDPVRPKPEPEQKTASASPPPAAAAVKPTQPPPDKSPKLLKTPLWATFKAGFPHWAEKINDRVSAMNSAGASEEEVATVVMRAMVKLRRSHAATALSAPPENLKTIAAAFVANLQFLRKNSVEACYGFIAEGDLNKLVLPMMLDPARAGPLHRQPIAVLRAINAGRTSKIAYASPKKEDFEALSNQLTKRGWSRQDLQLFSDPAALSKAPHAQVCRLVTEWFETQLALPDDERKMRLLTASLSPVVAG
jgi:GYF domain 2